MKNSFSRRQMFLMGSVALAAIASAGLTPPDFFYTNPKKELISFEEAHASLKAILEKQTVISAKVFGVQYDKKDLARIDDRVWDAAKLALSEFYSPKEDRSGIDLPVANDKAPATTPTTTTGGAPPMMKYTPK